jgi:transcriptional regulator with XRE-family HTH domain
VIDDRALAGHRLRVRLRAHRAAVALTQSQVAQRLGWSSSKVHRIEAGTSPLTDTDLGRLLGLYEVHGSEEIEELRRMADAARKPESRAFRDILPASVRRYMDYERAARQIWNFEPTFVPGLLQTADYTRALLSRVSLNARDEQSIERAVAARSHRQRILDAIEPVQLEVLIDQSVIARGVGGPRVMKNQLEHLWAMSQRPNISVGIIPFSEGAYPGMRTPFVVMRFSDSTHGDLLFLEDPVSEVITLGADDDSSPHPDPYLSAFHEMRALCDRKSDVSQQFRAALRDLQRDES